MIRDICKDQAFLAQKAEPASPEDLPVAADLLETLEVHRDGCVGMAANMIGVRPRKRYRVRAVHAKNATIIDRTIERCMGQNTGGVVMISSRGFTAVIIIQ